MKAIWQLGMMVVCLAVGLTVNAKVTLPEIFGNGMVLQRDMKVAVWGWADPDEKVTVSFNGQTREVKTGVDRRWRVELAPMAAGGPCEMIVNGSNSLKFSDVMVGEVWLCAGQSNMVWRLQDSEGADKEVASAQYPTIRYFQMKKEFAPSPRMECSGEWKRCVPENARLFSAVAYFFGRELNQKLNVPIGLVDASANFSRIEAWTPAVGFKMLPSLKKIYEETQLKDAGSPEHQALMQKTVKQYREWTEIAERNSNDHLMVPLPPPYPDVLKPYDNMDCPTVFYNAMINPLTPMAMRGAIWYQGEANLRDGDLYVDKMEALANGWRRKFSNSEMPIFTVQLTPFNYPDEPIFRLPLFWEAQAKAAVKIPNCGMVITNDIGDVNNKRPRQKQDVGTRLAALALERTYGIKGSEIEVPRLAEMSVEPTRLVLRFSGAQELRSRDGKALTDFEIAAKDGFFFPASATIDGSKIVLFSPKVTEPVAMRFAWRNIAAPNLVNEKGMAVGAFRSGRLSERAELDALVPEARNYRVVYCFDPVVPAMNDSHTFLDYEIDRSAEMPGRIKRVAYFLLLIKPDGSQTYVFTAMDSFVKNFGRIGVPTKGSGAWFQIKVKNLMVKSNVPGVANGNFPEGNIEFWSSDYLPKNSARIPGAADDKFDFGDQPVKAKNPGYGSMQVHNFTQKQTVWAFNRWAAAHKCDLGIGNSPSGAPDWTGTSSAAQYLTGKLMVLVELEAGR